MAVASELNKTQTIADGTVGPFTFGFRVDNAIDLVVISTDVTSGVSVTHILTTNYTISGLTNPNGGTITFVSGMQPASGKRLTMFRDVPYTQDLDLLLTGDLPSESVEKQLDKIVFQTQQLQEIFNRTVVLPVTTLASTSGALPDPSVSTNFGKFLRFKADGTGIEAITINAGQEASLLTTKGDLLSFASAAGRVAVGANDTIPVADSSNSFGWVWKSLVTWLNTLLTTKGDIIVRDATGAVRKAVGTNGQVIAADSNITDGLRYRKGSLGQTFRGLHLRTHPDSDSINSKIMLVHADEIVMDDGEPVETWDRLVADITVAGAGGLDTGSEAASTWYEAYAIRKRSDGTKNLLLHRAKDYFKDTSHDGSTDATRSLRLLTGTPTDKIAQGFQVATAGLVEFVDVVLDRDGTVSGNFWFTIEADSSGDPSGTPLATSDKYDAARIPDTGGNGSFLRIPFRNPATISASTQFHLVLQGDYARSDTAFIKWAGTVAGGYANGSSKDFNGTVWAATPGAQGLDRLFKLYIARNDTAVTMPSGFDQKCLVGYCFNDSGSNLRRFLAQDRTVLAIGAGTGANSWHIGTVTSSLVLTDLASFMPPVPSFVRFYALTPSSDRLFIGTITATDLVDHTAASARTADSIGTWGDTVTIGNTPVDMGGLPLSYQAVMARSLNGLYTYGIHMFEW